MTQYTIHTDGGARGNPGPAAIGVVIEAAGSLVATLGRYIGETTNNQAEYQAVHAALEWVVEHGGGAVNLFADSELIVKQLRGEYRVKNRELAPWHQRCQGLVRQLGPVTFTAIPRAQNAAADAEVNRVLDEQAAR